MSTFGAWARRLIADRRGTVFIEYSSLVLLLALAAIVLLSQWGSGTTN